MANNIRNAIIFCGVDDVNLFYGISPVSRFAAKNSLMTLVCTQVKNLKIPRRI